MKKNKLKRNLIWIDPPQEDEEPPREWRKHLAPLKKREGEWAQVVTGYPSSIHALHRYVSVVMEQGEWEFVVKPVDQVRAGLWAKYLGKP